jgi:HTH-type transcriptional regulator/antitoxin HigA
MEIVTQRDYHAAMVKLNDYVAKGLSNMTEDESQEYGDLARAVEAFEDETDPMPLPVTLPAILAEYMQSNKINQNQLSRKLDLPAPTISALVNGKKKMNIDIAKKIHKQLQIDGNTLLEAF